MSSTDLLAHHQGDAVAVAVKDLEPGKGSVGYLDDGPEASVEVIERVPLGHKVALKDLASGGEVVEYGTVIGRTTRDILTGEHVHVHNVKGERWA